MTRTSFRRSGTVLPRKSALGIAALAWLALPATVPAREASSDLAALVMECRGTIEIEGPGETEPRRVEECSGPHAFDPWIPPGTRIFVVEGQLTLVRGSGEVITRRAGKEFFDPPVKSKRPVSWRESFDAHRRALLAVFGPPELGALLKGGGDETFPGHGPRLVLHDESRLVSFGADGFVLNVWSGLVEWSGLPPGYGRIVRVYADGERVFGPSPLPSALFDLSTVSAADAEELRLELLLIERGKSAPLAALERTAESLLSLPRSPVRTVLVTDLRRQGRPLRGPGPEPDPGPETGPGPELADHAGEPWTSFRERGEPVAAAALAASHGRLALARAMVDELGEPAIHRRLSGIRVLGYWPEPAETAETAETAAPSRAGRGHDQRP